MALGPVARGDPRLGACVEVDIQNRIHPEGNAMKHDLRRKRSCRCERRIWLKLVEELLAKWGEMKLLQTFWLIERSAQNQTHFETLVLIVHEPSHHHEGLSCQNCQEYFSSC